MHTTSTKRKKNKNDDCKKFSKELNGEDKKSIYKFDSIKGKKQVVLFSVVFRKL